MNVKVDDTRLTFSFLTYSILSGVSRVPPDVGFNNMSLNTLYINGLDTHFYVAKVKKYK